jgi:2-polyprenyl-3-methyl-5-hydroxy-6-metoxy-1,4-benzoquinol methylase
MSEKTYNDLKKFIQKNGLEKMGIMTSWAWYDDPKRLSFMLSRYKFVSKMLSGLKDVAEVGCGDGFGSRVVSQSVKNLDCFDFDKELLETSKFSINLKRNNTNFYFHDILKNKLNKKYDAIYSLDVFEHIQKSKEKVFIKNIRNSLRSKGVLIIGTPSIESQKYASKFSKIGHVNCKNQTVLKELLEKYFSYTFAFSMNDEIIHTGYAKMSHYNILICAK